MLSFISGTEICSRTLLLSKDRVLSPENISVIIRATTGITWGTEGGHFNRRFLNWRDEGLSSLVWVSHLDHDELPLPGPPVRPLLPEAQANVERREAWSLATLVGYHPWTTHTFNLKKQTLNGTF